MRLLVIGGTHFVGRAYVELAAERGHDVTVFHRGTDEPAGFPEVEHVHGDRLTGLDALGGREWDSALDTCAYFPRAVRLLGDAVASRVGHYAFVSTLSVLPDPFPVGADESTPTHGRPHPDTEDVTNDTYGPLKVACELEARAAFAHVLVIRPGYIVGPWDPTGRFTSLVRRAASGGEMLAPGPPEAPVQVVDVRDLATFMLDRVEAGDTETYGVVGPGEAVTTAGWLGAARDAAGADTIFTWVTPDFIRGTGDEWGAWLPIWDPDPGTHHYDCRRAVAAGLHHRRFAATVADTLAWDREQGEPELRAGFPAGKERELLAAWHARS